VQVYQIPNKKLIHAGNVLCKTYWNKTAGLANGQQLQQMAAQAHVSVNIGLIHHFGNELGHPIHSLQTHWFPYVETIHSAYSPYSDKKMEGDQLVPF
jgi:hypothetical protein